MLVDFISGTRVYCNDDGNIKILSRRIFLNYVKEGKIDNILNYQPGDDINSVDSYVIDRNICKNESILYFCRDKIMAHNSQVSGINHLYIWFNGGMYDIYKSHNILNIGSNVSIKFMSEPNIYYKYICKSKKKDVFLLSFIVEFKKSIKYYAIEFSQKGISLIDTTNCSTRKLYSIIKIVHGVPMTREKFMKVSILSDYRR